ncbi:MAG TPA: aminomethyl-transferring glycine dehydrogenase subunit GcvPA [Chloroflexia bacterium]|nr:aminomethyl-transferring glycine dehydrogenase subunit GcvPA [Chloroflexia bacterium]
MVYTPNTEAQRQEMLESIGLNKVEDLYREVPPSVLDPKIDLPEPLSEPEIMAEMRRLSELNADSAHYATFLGAGSYNHYSPSAVYRIMSRSEFYTAYTPYQPELSQGTLQQIYEFQTLICQLTGMDVANASMYDAASALGEAAVMASAVTRRKQVIISPKAHPEHKAVLRTYAGNHGIEVIERDANIGQAAELGGDVACVVVQQPNFLGEIRDLTGLADKVHEAGAMLIVIFDPISLGMLKSPGEVDADIAIGEGQSLGVPMSFGGPYLGLLATKDKYVRQMPGRLAGMTKDTEGRRGFVLTLQTREQHIRREKATSNICTNEGLMAVAATAYMCLMGPQGLKRVAELCYQRSHYLSKRIAALPGYKIISREPFFKEFAVQTPIPPAELNHRLLEQKIIGGLDISGTAEIDGAENAWLLCVTELNTREQLDALVSALEAMGTR